MGKFGDFGESSVIHQTYTIDHTIKRETFKRLGFLLDKVLKNIFEYPVPATLSSYQKF